MRARTGSRRTFVPRWAGELVQLHIGKVRARRRALEPGAAPLAPSQYESVPPGTIVLDEPGIYHTAHEPANVGTFSERAMLGTGPAAAWALPGLAPDPQTILAPAPGSENLTTLQNVGGRPGTQRLNRAVGPVTGPVSVWTGNRADLPSNAIGAAGPVGRADYGAQLNAAYAAANRRVLDQASIEAQLVAAL